MASITYVSKLPYRLANLKWSGGVRYIIWSGVVSITLYGVVRTGIVVSVTLYDLVWTGRVGSVMVFGLGQPGLVQNYYGLVWSGLGW